VAEQHEDLVLRLLREIREQLERKSAFAEFEHDIRADVASDMILVRKTLCEQIAGLRLAVVAFRSSVIDQGVLVGELEARTRRVDPSSPTRH
jgi:hypothetical protein